jgi:signal transduction histidine kinase
LSLPLARKGVALTIVPMVVVVAVLVSAFTFQQRSSQLRTQIAAGTLTVIDASAVAEWVSVAESSVRGYAATGDPALLDDYDEAVAALPDPVDRLRDRAPAPFGADADAVVALTETSMAALDAARVELLAGAPAAAALAPATEAVARWWVGIDTLRFEMLSNLADDVTAQSDWQDRTRTTLVGGLLALIAISLASGYVLASSLVGRTLRLADNVERFSAGDPILPSHEAGDELGDLTNTMAKVGQLVLDQQAELEASRDAALAASSAKDEFLSRTSHELRTPLTAIIGFSQIMQMDDEHLSDDDRDSVERIVHAGHHLLALINDILDIAKIEEGQLTITLRSVPVTDILRTTTALVLHQAAERSITITSGPADDICVEADPNRLTQVLANLLTNAVKFNHPGGHVRVGCTLVGHDADGHDLVGDDPAGHPGDRVRLSVADTGPGIAPDDLERVFEPFERLDASDRGIEGTGVGLALSKDLVEAMGGTIGVDSALGSGSTFWIELARATPRDEPEPPAVAGAGVNVRPGG